MEHRRFGNTDMDVSVLGFGGAEIGFEAASAETVSRLLNAALDAGLNVIDTAECYKNSEELIGEAVSHRRGDFYLFSKCGHASGFELPDWDVAMLEMQIDRSLQRLQTDHLDLIQLHTCSEELLRQGDVIDVLKRAKSAGKARYIGYSGDSKAARYAVECGAFDSLQTSINIADQEAIDLTVPLAGEKGMGVIAKRPVANVAWRNAPNPPDSQYALPYWERLKKLQFDFLAQPSAVETALNFTVKVPGLCTAIVGTKNPDRWVENAKLLANPMSDQAYNAIRARWKEVAEPDWIGQG